MHLGPGPGVDDVHARSLRAALVTGEALEVIEPGESEDFGVDWAGPARSDLVRRARADRAVELARPGTSVTGRTWGGCIEVIQWILTAGRFPADPASWTAGCSCSRPGRS